MSACSDTCATGKAEHTEVSRVNAPESEKCSASSDPGLTIVLIPTITIQSCGRPHYSYCTRLNWKADPSSTDAPATGSVPQHVKKQYARIVRYLHDGVKDVMKERTDMTHPCSKDWPGWTTQAVADVKGFETYSKQLQTVFTAAIGRDFYRDKSFSVTVSLGSVQHLDRSRKSGCSELGKLTCATNEPILRVVRWCRLRHHLRKKSQAEGRDVTECWSKLSSRANAGTEICVGMCEGHHH